MAITVIITITKKLNPACLKAYEVGNLLAGFNFSHMKNLNKECPVTGKEVIDPLEAPQSSINGTALAFCTSTCKSIFDRYLVKFAEKLYPASGQPYRAIILNPKYKR